MRFFLRAISQTCRTIKPLRGGNQRSHIYTEREKKGEISYEKININKNIHINRHEDSMCIF